jgi:membrane-bound lytic murein transglycosylase D
MRDARRSGTARRRRRALGRAAAVGVLLALVAGGAGGCASRPVTATIPAVAVPPGVQPAPVPLVLEPPDLPIVVRREVRAQLARFQGVERKNFAHSLDRFGAVGVPMRAILAARGVPRDLVFLAMIESRFNTGAVSRSGAVGPWQFLRETALDYGLRIDPWVDERRDPVASTQAAATYLAAAYRQFGDWPLAIASFNAGMGGVARAMKTAGANDFWKLARTQALKAEARDYVPRVMAAAIVTRDPAGHGFPAVTRPPVVTDVVLVTRPTALSVAARLAGVSEQDLVDLNPALLLKITPPQDATYPLRVPGSLGERLAAALKSDFDPETVYRVHEVQAGQDLDAIARDYGITVAGILAKNEARTVSRRGEGTRIILPLPPLSAANLVARKVSPGPPGELRPDAAVAETVAASATAAEITTVRPTAPAFGAHRVEVGDNLTRIARRYGTTIETLRTLNGLTTDVVRLGQTLRVPAQTPSAIAAAAATAPASVVTQPVVAPPVVTPPVVPTPEAPRPSVVSARDARIVTESITHAVAPGESLYTIAARYGVGAQTIRRANGLTQTVVHPGQSLRIPVPRPQDENLALVSYEAAPGDNLTRIAKRFDCAVADLVRWNDLTDLTVQAGQRLRVLVPKKPSG